MEKIKEEGMKEGGGRQARTDQPLQFTKRTLSPEEGLGMRPLTCISALETMPKQEAACCLMLILSVSSCTDRGCQSGWKRKHQTPQ